MSAKQGDSRIHHQRNLFDDSQDDFDTYQSSGHHHSDDDDDSRGNGGDHHHDDQCNIQVLPPHGVIAGQTISAWTEDWWRWIVQQPDKNLSNPDWDKNGSFESNQPGGGMYFLAGSWGNDPVGGVERTIGAIPGHHVPACTPVMIPILNLISSQFQTDPADFNDTSIAQWLASVKDVFLKIDGQAIKDLASDLVRTGSFSAGPATKDTVGAVLADPATGRIEVLKGIGYYAEVKLSAGQHTIEFGGDTTSFSVHVIDHLTVG